MVRTPDLVDFVPVVHDTREVPGHLGSTGCREAASSPSGKVGSSSHRSCIGLSGTRTPGLSLTSVHYAMVLVIATGEQLRRTITFDA
jgi:hypothetical protein